MNNKLVWGIVAVLVIIGGIYLLNLPAETKVTNEDTVVGEGRVVFSVTDAAANMGNVSEVNMTISRVDMHNTVDGWMAVSTTPKTYNLLALKANNESKVLADVEAEVNAYDQVRVTIDSVSIKTKAGVTEQAALPAKEFTMNTVLIVDADNTSSVSLDFLVDKSLHTTIDGDYVFAPVIKTEIKSQVGVSVDALGTVLLTGGTLDDTDTFGMDLTGAVKLDFELNSAQKLNIGDDNTIKIEGALLKK